MALSALEACAALARRWEGTCQASCLCVVAYANFVRHDASKIPRPAGDAPRTAFLTVHTLAVEGAWVGLCCRPRRRPRVARASQRQHHDSF